MFSGAFHGNAGNHMVVNRYDSGCCASEGSAFRVGGRLRFPSHFYVKRRGGFGCDVCDAVYHKAVYTLDDDAL